MLIALVAIAGLAACGPVTESADQIQGRQQAQNLREGVQQVGNPNIVNFEQMRMMKGLIEMLDQPGVVTYTYTFSEYTGRPVFFCNSIGYGIPYATQFTNPERIAHQSATYGIAVLPQAEPDGLFRPSSAEASWIMCVDPRTRVARPVYMEPRAIISQYALTPDTPAGGVVPVAIMLPGNTEATPLPAPATP